MGVVRGLCLGWDVRAPTLGRMQSFYVLAALLGVAACMDVGRSGVYDSPLANDYYVRRFGFMFGGGRSGLQGLQAMQNRVDSYHRYIQPSYYRPCRIEWTPITATSSRATTVRSIIDHHLQGLRWSWRLSWWRVKPISWIVSLR